MPGCYATRKHTTDETQLDWVQIRETRTFPGSISAIFVGYRAASYAAMGQILLAALGMHWLCSDLRPGPRGGHFCLQCWEC